jgi:hypothetical protein
MKYLRQTGSAMLLGIMVSGCLVEPVLEGGNRGNFNGTATDTENGHHNSENREVSGDGEPVKPSARPVAPDQVRDTLANPEVKPGAIAHLGGVGLTTMEVVISGALDI